METVIQPRKTIVSEQTKEQRIAAIKAQIASLRECLPYADSAQARTADQDRIRQLEATLRELQGS